MAYNFRRIYPTYAGVQSNRTLPEGGPMTNPEIYGWQSILSFAQLWKRMIC